MDTQATSRVFPGLVYLGLLLLIGGAVYTGLNRYTGRMVVPVHGSESVAAAPVTSAGGWLQPTLDLDSIPFASPEAARRVFDGNAQYVAAHLPFHVRLDSVEAVRQPPPVETLVAVVDGETTSHVIEDGSVIRVNGAPLTIGRRAAWQGLLHNPHGAPMAAVEFVHGEGEEIALLDDGAWCADRTGTVAVQFRWFTGISARAGLGTMLGGMTGVPERRWGVREGDRVHWFTGARPGTGIVLDDGRDVTLLAAKDEVLPPTLDVGIKYPDGRTVRYTVRANAGETEVGLVYDAWDAYPWRIHLAASEDGHCWYRIAGESSADVDDAWEGEKILQRGNVAVVARQVMGRAIPVSGAGDPLYARTVRIGGTVATLPEGATVSVEGLRLRYQTVPQPPEQRYGLTILENDGSVRERFDLSGQGAATVGTWQIELAARAPVAKDLVVVQVRRATGGPAQVAGMILFAVGAVGYVVSRVGRRRSTFTG